VRSEEEHNSFGRQLIASLLFAATFALPIMVMFVFQPPKSMAFAAVTFFALMTASLVFVVGRFERKNHD